MRGQKTFTDRHQTASTQFQLHPPKNTTSTLTATAHHAYDRKRDLPRLIAMWPHELEAITRADHLRLIGKLRRALQRERQSGLGGHWTYDLSRHRALLSAYRAEVRAYLSGRAS
jgi:hypothetical protein